MTEHCCQVCALSMMFCRSDCRLCADMVVSDCAISWLYRVIWHSDRPTWDMKNIICIWFSHFTLTEIHRGSNYSLSLYFNKKSLSVLTAHAGLAIWQPCSISRDIVVNWQQKLKFFVAHTVNCVICNTHATIDWMLLNFTPVIQQNCHQPGRKFEKSFCAIDRLSCLLELSKSETSQFRSDFVFDIVTYVHAIFLHGG